MAKHKQEDPWAGFVDVLSNILMVVIFLVVILGLAIYALSQQITKTAVETAIKEERERAESAASSSQSTSETPAARKVATAEAPVAVAKPQGNVNLAVQSRAVTTAREIEVPAEEKPKDQPIEPVSVKAAASVLTLKFKVGAFKIDTQTSEKIQDYLKTADGVRDNVVEIRAFAQSTIGSVSEARRLAYYRAMLARTELIKSGVPAGKIDVKVRESRNADETDAVAVFIK